ncbi:MAG: helix-turn-helix transcriptional regulator [Clostridia bacterium]|nr:helix-turn-helix transcriptional regulator [Clostridia bacterium]
MKRLYVCEGDAVHQDVVDAVKPDLLCETEAIDLAALYKLFGDGTRVKILQALRVHELCVCDLACLLGMTKSAISHQLKALRMSNLVRFRREGQNVFYALADEHVEKILDLGLEHLRE